VDFAVGQECIYKGAIVPSSRAIIGRIDQGLVPGERIVSVTITDVPLPNPKTGKFEPTEVGHAPIDGKAFEQSVVGCSGFAPVSPDFEDGYRTWRAAFDRHEAGVFTVSLGELQHILARMLSTGAK